MMDLGYEDSIKQFEDSLSCLFPTQEICNVMTDEQIEEIIQKLNLDWEQSTFIKNLEQELCILKPKSKTPFPWVGSELEARVLCANGVNKKTINRVRQSHIGLPKWKYEFDFTKKKKSVKQPTVITDTKFQFQNVKTQKQVTISDFTPQVQSILNRFSNLDYLFDNSNRNENSEATIFEDENEPIPIQNTATTTTLINLLD